MRIHLLTISGLGLEIRREGLTVHEPVSSDYTDGSALGENVQKGGLFFCQLGLKWLMDKGGRTFPAPDSPISAVNLPGTT